MYLYISVSIYCSWNISHLFFKIDFEFVSFMLLEHEDLRMQFVF